MKEIADELTGKVKEIRKDHDDLEGLINRVSVSIQTFRKDHSAIAGAAEAAIGFSAIAIGASLFNPADYATKVPELIGSVVGGSVGGGVGGFVASMVGGIGVAMMGSAFAIPALAVTTIGAVAGASSGLVAGWFGAEIAAHTTTLAEMLFANISGTALVAFGCYMLFIALKDLWRAGGEFIDYLRNLGVKELSIEELT